MQGDTSIRCDAPVHIAVMAACMLVGGLVGTIAPIYAGYRILKLDAAGQLYSSEAGLLFQSLYEPYRRTGKYGVLRDFAGVTEIISLFVRSSAVVMLVLQTDAPIVQASVCMGVTLTWLVIVGPWCAYRETSLAVPATPFSDAFELRDVMNKVNQITSCQMRSHQSHQNILKSNQLRMFSCVSHTHNKMPDGRNLKRCLLSAGDAAVDGDTRVCAQRRTRPVRDGGRLRGRRDGPERARHPFDRGRRRRDNRGRVHPADAAGLLLVRRAAARRPAA